MLNNEDFFSPERLDERLAHSLLAHNPDDAYREPEKTDANVQLIHDLRDLYGAEGTENVRSLQRVWERLAEQHMSGQNDATGLSTEPGSHLRLLKSSQKAAATAQEIKRRRKRVPGRSLAVLAAALFLVIMVGSLLAIVHFTHQFQAPFLGTVSTPAVQPTQAQPTPIPGYPYPAPGQNISLSPTSSDGFSALAWSWDSQQVAGSTQGKVWIWGATTGKQSLVFDPGTGMSVRSLAWSPGALLLAVGSNLVQVINPANGNVVFTDPALPGYSPVNDGSAQPLVTALAWSPDGTLLAVATQNPDSSCAVRIWNVQTGSLVYTFTGQNSGGAISSISWSGDGKYVASADGQSIQAWDVQSGNVIFQQPISTATNVAWSWSPNLSLLAFVSGTTTEVWNVWTGKIVSQYPDTANGILTWSPNGRYLATASGSNIIIWDTQNGAHIYTYTGNAHYVRSLAWSPDGNYLASSESSTSGDNVARVWTA